MFIKKIEATNKKPLAFKDKTDIEYVTIHFDDMGFMVWRTGTIQYTFQISKGFRDLSELLYYFFTEIIPIKDDEGTFQICIGDEILNKTEWKFNGGNWRMNDSDKYRDSFQRWDLHSYNKFKGVK